VALASGRDRHSCRIEEGGVPSRALRIWFDLFPTLPKILERPYDFDHPLSVVRDDLDLLIEWSKEATIPRREAKRGG